MKYITYGRWTRQTHHKTMKQYIKPRKSFKKLFDPGFVETIPSPCLGFLGGVFLADTGHFMRS